MEMRKCRNCGKEFKSWPCRKTRHFFCSRLCFAKYHTKQGIIIHTNGYIMVKINDHHLSNKWGWVYLHRVMAEMKLGRELLKGEVVHHINENPQDNSLDNLQITTQSKHAKEHMMGNTHDRDYRRKLIQGGI